MPRKKPFSNKQKKKQLQVKRERKRGDTGSGPSSRNASVERGGERQSDTSDSETTDIRKINQQPMSREGRYDPNRFRLHFEKESKEEVEKRKKLAREKVLQPVSDKELEVDINEIYPSEKRLSFPRRPSWTYNMTRESLMKKEEKSYRDYLDDLHSRNPPGTLSHFEHNLETWRQLWRVLEMSDIILLIVDIRHPVLQFPPDLYHYITKDLQKHVILVLNKADLCPPPLVIAWKHYMASQFPSLNIVCFTSHPGQPYSTVLQKKRTRKKPDWSHAGGLIDIFKSCQEITSGRVDLSSLEQKIQRDAVAQRLDDEHEGAESVLVEHQSDSAMEMSSSSHELYKDGVLTLGCIGFPNVGKSSIINSLVGRKVVSVSRTPGHTKYFQTYYLTPTVKLCDCPGLVFPSRVNKELQILSGIYPVSQLQEPYTSVGYLCERTPFLSVLKLKHPSLQDMEPQHKRSAEESKWTAWDVCEAWAERRGYKTAKAARNDVYRAANSLLRLAIDGRLCLCLRPLGYSCLKEHWENHVDLPEIIALQGRAAEEEGAGERDDDEDGESSTEPEEERDRDADDDEDGDDEDEGCRDRRQKNENPPGFTVNIFNVLRENECE
ncbi:Guanine nucleotide-binding protein-like 1 [Oryzias melastigma]|uniref:Guanine nucleotide-binding protein-like 1 n=1 Tax=Oryzias melastigma TaxID=30732 RepID=A0A3B3C578_ORYME|nr:guanine nucleotide-binding protein-like 1 [Oryzias melastigma]KAF6722011.1 Guanine nucleotide-binding protein-like 1 [Oryzias melastigma]